MYNYTHIREQYVNRHLLDYILTCIHIHNAMHNIY